MSGWEILGWIIFIVVNIAGWTITGKRIKDVKEMTNVQTISTLTISLHNVQQQLEKLPCVKNGSWMLQMGAFQEKVEGLMKEVESLRGELQRRL